MVVAYDKKALYHDQLLLSLPFDEGDSVLYDRAKPHHPFNGNNGWTQLTSNLPVASFNGINQYMDCAAASSADLDITVEDYSVVGWINYGASLQSQIVIGRYGVDLDGWEVYLYSVNNTLSLRHHHSSLAPDNRDGCYSEDWNINTWYLFGISRDSLYPRHFRNGVEVEVTYETGGLKDPDTCNRDPVVGVRFTKNADWYGGYMAFMRVWVGKSLTLDDHRYLFETERHWFGV